MEAFEFFISKYKHLVRSSPQTNTTRTTELRMFFSWVFLRSLFVLKENFCFKCSSSNSNSSIRHTENTKKENYANKCGCVLLTQRWRLNMSLLYFSFYGVLFLFECVRHHWGNEHRAIFGIWINLSFKSSGKRFSLIALLNGTKWKSYAATKSEYLFWYSESPHLSLSRTILYRSRYFRVSLCVHYHFTHSVLSWKLAKKTHQTTNNRKTEKKNQF